MPDGLALEAPARDKARVSRRALVLVVTLCAACAARTPRLPYAGPLDDFLAAHPLSDGQNIRADEIGRTATASYHVVQVRGAESPHRHVAHDLTVVVLRGHGTLTRDAERVALVAGDAAVVARGAPHWFANGARSPAVALVVFAPPLDAPDMVPVGAR
jgi:quercetin dioxygenase-like cupin family protein